MKTRRVYVWLITWAVTSISIPLVLRWGTPFGTANDGVAGHYDAFAWFGWIATAMLIVWLVATVVLAGEALAFLRRRSGRT